MDYLWYKRTFQIQSSAWYEGDNSQYRLILHFDKVDYETVVYLNGYIVGPKHTGGYDPFSYDISPYFMNNEDNELIVRVWDPSNYGFQARGKQKLNAENENWIFYIPCTGIWGTVWIERVPRVRIDRLQFQTRLSSTHVQLKYRIDLAIAKTNLSDPLPIPNEEAFPVYRNENFTGNQEDLLDAKKIEKSTEMKTHFNLKITIQNLTTLMPSKPNIEQEISFPLTTIHLWSPENPYLYDIHIDLYEKNVFIERIYSYIGFRQISLCSKTKKICLNNQPYFILGVLDQGYWPDGLYRPITDDAYRYDIEQMKKLGFNTLRKHMKSEPSRWYYWCDRIGMLVWQDMPAGDSYDGYEMESVSDTQLRLHRDNRTNNLPIPPPKIEPTTPRSNTERSLESKIQFEKELKSMIDFLSFHPSIIIWVLFNEAWGQYDTVRLSTWLQSYDQDRLVNSASGWQDGFGSGHMRDIHDYTKHILLPSMSNDNRTLVIGECGGFGLMTSGWSYNSFSDRYLLTYAFEQLIFNLSPQISAMIYTQLSDVENELNGILTYDRKRTKFLASHLKRVLKNDFSRLYKLESIWNLATRPHTNYQRLYMSRTFNITINSISNNTLNHHFYLYICYLYSQVNITIDYHHKLILNQTHIIRDYHYISLPYDLFRGSIRQEHNLEITLKYQPSPDDENKTIVYKNRTYFDLRLAMLFA